MAERKNELDAFDQHVRGSLEQFEVPYNSADWTQLERTLDGERRGWWFSGAGLATLLIAGAVAVGGATYLWSNGQDRIAEGSTVTSTNDTPRQGDRAPEKDASAQNTTAATPATASTPANTNTPNNPGEPSAKGGGMHGASAAIMTNDHSGNTAEHRSINPAPVVRTLSTADLTTTATPADSKAATPAETAKAEPTFRASISEGCPGAPVHFKVEHMPEDGIYLWNFGDGSFSNKPNPEHTFTKPGNYQVMLSMSAAGVGTIHNKPSSDMIVIHEAPHAAFNALKQEYDGHIPSVHFENRAMGGKSYVWSFGDGATSEIAHPDHIFKKKGIYQVELTVTNDIGCVDKTLREVRIEKDYNLDAPAAFSPDGDGTDETFIPVALRQLGVKFHLAVYDTNGGLLYETTDATKPWTGRLNNRGEVLAAGEYVWVVDVSENLHLAETYTGKVQLVR